VHKNGLDLANRPGHVTVTSQFGAALKGARIRAFSVHRSLNEPKKDDGLALGRSGRCQSGSLRSNDEINIAVKDLQQR
jgi:hypothetical protein